MGEEMRGDVVRLTDNLPDMLRQRRVEARTFLPLWSIQLDSPLCLFGSVCYILIALPLRLRTVVVELALRAPGGSTAAHQRLLRSLKTTKETFHRILCMRVWKPIYTHLV